MKRTRRAYTLTEMAIVSIIIGVMTAIAIPRFNLAAIHKQTADRLAKKLVTDFRYTRMLAISDAADNVTGYRMVMQDGPPYSSYIIQNRDTSEILLTHQIDSDVDVTGGDNFEFGPLGNLTGSSTELTVTASDRSFTITITPTIGSVQCVEN